MGFFFLGYSPPTDAKPLNGEPGVFTRGAGHHSERAQALHLTPQLQQWTTLGEYHYLDGLF